MRKSKEWATAARVFMTTGLILAIVACYASSPSPPSGNSPTAWESLTPPPALCLPTIMLPSAELPSSVTAAIATVASVGPPIRIAESTITSIPLPTVAALKTLSAAQWREQFRKPTELCPEGEMVDMTPLIGKTARLTASSTGKVVEKFLDRTSFQVYFPGMQDFSSRGIDGALVPEIRSSLSQLLGSGKWNALAFYVARNEADLPRKFPEMTSDQMAEIEARAFKDYLLLVSDARAMPNVGQEAVVMGVTIFPPPDRNPKVAWIVDEWNTDLVTHSGQGYVAVDLRACESRMTFRDAIHIDDNTVENILFRGIRRVMIREASRPTKLPVWKSNSPN